MQSLTEWPDCNSYSIFRVRNNTTKVSLPLKNRSKASLVLLISRLVKRIQEDASSDYIILLDEPGLIFMRLHKPIYSNSLKIFRKIPDYLHNSLPIHGASVSLGARSELSLRPKTVLENIDVNTGKGPQYPFPLQAAHGYDLAQNLFISKKNLL